MTGMMTGMIQTLESLGIVTEPVTEVKPSKSTAEVLAYSRSVSGGPDLITVKAVFARSALAEVNTHRKFSRNSASSRAIPVKKMLEQVTGNPYIPKSYSLAQKGMHTNNFISFDADYDKWLETTLGWWLPSRDAAVNSALEGLNRGLHKQDVNRILEPFMMHTAIISSTEWENFFNQRMGVDEKGSPLAYPPIYELAVAIHKHVVLNLFPTQVRYKREKSSGAFENMYDWHLPLIGFEGDEELSLADQVRVSAARCARVSYLTHDGIRDVDADLALCNDKLLKAPHLSPFEHVAHPHAEGSGNFDGWRQARYYVEKGLFF